MKILLIQPAKPARAVGGEDFAIYEPLALEYLAAGVEGSHDFRILDMRIDSDLRSILQSFRPDVVGITAYTVHVNNAVRLFAEIKSFDSHIVTVVGGHHATIMPEDFQSPNIDVIVSGEGVFIFREIISHLEDGLDDVTGIPGSVRMKNGTVLIKQGDDGIDLDAYPFPRRDLTSKYREYYGSEWMRPLASIRTSKGCHFRCRFCALWKLAGGRYLVRKPERIVEELKTIREKYVFFSDDESLLDVRRMEKLADMIEQEGIRKRYFLYGRSDTVSRNPGLIEKWKKIGLERVFVGLEFFRDEDLKLIKKGSSVENNIKAVQVLKGLGLDIFPMFIVRPDFTKKDFDDLRKFCLSLDLDFIGFSVLTPLPGTDLYDEVKDDLITSNYDYFDFFHTHLRTALPMKDFYRELIKLYNHSRSIRSQLRFLRKFPLRELPAAFKVFSRFLKRLKQLEADY